MISNYLKCGFFGKNTQRPVVDKENPADALQSLQKNKLTAEISEDRASVGYDNGKNEVLAVIVHRTDRIKSKLYITHPTIKIHLLNVQTGQYVKKSRSNKPGSYFTENRSIDYLLPQMTKPSIITHQNTIPCWEELIVFNEYVSYLTSMNDDVVILFELLDFVNMKRLTSRRKITLLDEGNDSDSGWVRIAWAFLKLQPHLNKSSDCCEKIRLQLYRASKKTKMKDNQQTTEIFMWYRCNVRSKYRGSLFVTVKPTVCLSSISTALRSMYPSQAEKRASLTSKETSNFKEELETSHKLENQVVWAKLTGEICKVPNKKVENLYPGKNGCLSIVFSKNGR
uniref:C2 domain-containing protein n=1 Tax=Romanomermis culicivorax TaxID=13658 RepID=A0A915JX22_ROMCU